MIFVDPCFKISDVMNIKDLFTGCLLVLKHLRVVMKLGRDPFFKSYSPRGFLDRSDHKLRPYYKAALFYETYRKKFSREILMNAEYITHWMDVKMDGSVDDDDLLDIAERLVNKYAHARMVITSRIHAGLPCLGLETPVVFVTSEEVTSEKGTFNTPGRLPGLLELFRTLSLSKGKFSTEDGVLGGIKMFDENTFFINKNDWEAFAVDLKRKVCDFMDRDQKSSMQ